MDVLIRENLEGSSGFQEFQDTEVQVERLTIGSAPDQQIQILGPDIKAQEAVITRRGDITRIKGIGKTTLQINGKRVRAGKLQQGDHIVLSGNDIHVISPPAGFDLALEVTRPKSVDAGAFENAFVTSLEKTGWSMRRLTWVLTFLVLLVSIILPLVSLALRDKDGNSLPGIPSDALWISGPLHPVHELAAGENCQLCHTDLFIQVQDDACRECHKDIEDHISTKLLEAHPENTLRCATCHREHNEPQSTLIVRADPLCTDCHDSKERMKGADALGLVSGFAEKQHPLFKATVLEPDENPVDPEVPWRSVTVELAQASEHSNLKFPHDVHMDVEKVRKQSTDEALECSDCHRLNNDREHFAAITMEAQCSTCHELTFDPRFPQRQLPHGKPEEVIFTLEGHYLKLINDPDYKPVKTTRRRRPDKKDKRPLVCAEATYDCALQKAARDADDQFTRQGCVSCHEVSVHPEQSLYQRYAVRPVKLVEDYYRNSVFDHGSHLIMKYPDKEESLSGTEACNTCHDARVSEKSSDLLMTDIDNCAQCHGSPGSDAVVELQCISCHQYHPTPTINLDEGSSPP